MDSKRRLWQRLPATIRKPSSTLPSWSISIPCPGTELVSFIESFQALGLVPAPSPPAGEAAKPFHFN